MTSWAIIRRLWEGSPSTFAQVVGQIQVHAHVGLTSLLPWLLGASLQSLHITARPHTGGLCPQSLRLPFLLHLSQASEESSDFKGSWTLGLSRESRLSSLLKGLTPYLHLQSPFCHETQHIHRFQEVECSMFGEALFCLPQPLTHPSILTCSCTWSPPNALSKQSLLCCFKPSLCHFFFDVWCLDYCGRLLTSVPCIHSSLFHPTPFSLSPDLSQTQQ